MSQFLGIDASTQGIAALIFDTEEMGVVAEASINFGEDLPEYGAPQGFIPGGPDGIVHADPLMWLDGLELCLGRLKTGGIDLGRIAALSGAGQQHGTVYLNKEGLDRLKRLDPGRGLADQFRGGFSRPTSPIWMDTSTSRQCREIESALGGPLNVCARSGSIAIERFSGPQIRRFAEEEPNAYALTERIHLVSSFLSSVLSGREAPIDHGDGAGMNLLNLETLDWDPELLEATADGLEKRLPPARPSATVVGPVAAYFVEKHGFSRGIPVVAFTGDNPSSLVGMGAGSPGKVVVSLGTSDTLFAAIKEPLTDPGGFGHVFGNPLGGFMTLQCFLNGSLAREAVRDGLRMDWDAFSKAIAETPPGNADKRMLPFFGPEISPRVDAGEPLLGGALGPDWTRDPASARACVEGQFLNMRLRSEWMHLQPPVLYLTGGAAANDAISQIAADVFQADVRRLDLSSSVALGAALRAGLALEAIKATDIEASFDKALLSGKLKPDPTTANLYAEALAEVRELQETAGILK
ncbi:MAG TPA: FGGY family carbohydrate kinase, partial [Oceanipulchritudo sp.]|nr:FGGY family carbohydrate kinase [Oceanipulchritudo sp.]